MEPEKYQLICPWWLGWALASPVRKLVNDPDKILSPYVNPGMKAVDYGCAMGYFTLPMARMVGQEGQVFAIDIQQKMIDGLCRRMRKAKLDEIINPILVTRNTDFKDLENRIDFVLLFAMVHEVPDQNDLFHKVAGMLKPGGSVLFVEPAGHVSALDFDQSVEIAVQEGLKVIHDISLKGSLSILLSK